MSDATSLTKEQISEIQAWADDGATLADIQKKLADEMDFRATYMEMRFLIEDIGVTLKPDEPKPKAEEPTPEVNAEENAEDVGEFSDADGPEEEQAEEALPSETDEEAEPEGPVKADVSVDEVQRPGMIVNGKVEFDGGKSLSWYLDQMGRLGVDPGVDEEFRPSEAQLRVFQENLQVALREKGFG